MRRLVEDDSGLSVSEILNALQDTDVTAVRFTKLNRAALKVVKIETIDGIVTVTTAEAR